MAPAAVAGQSKLSATHLKDACIAQHRVLQHQILEILITSYWLGREAASKGVVVTYNEAKRVLTEKFRTRAALTKFLRLTGEHEADEEFLLKRTMLADRVLASFEKLPGSRSHWQQAYVQFNLNLVKRWTPLTDCQAGYVVSQCRQHKTV